jgi:hypothetical protein
MGLQPPDMLLYNIPLGIPILNMGLCGKRKIIFMRRFTEMKLFSQFLERM